jgi:hypothetical protein
LPFDFHVESDAVWRQQGSFVWQIARKTAHQQKRVTYDVAGVEEAKEELSGNIEFPGTTEVPKAGAVSRASDDGPAKPARLYRPGYRRRANVLFSISGSDFLKCLRCRASRVATCLNKAKNAPCIIFIDEIDKLVAIAELDLAVDTMNVSKR